jgi:hypothetical protein
MVMSLDWPFFVFQRPSFLDGKNLNLGIIIFSLAMMVLTLLLWPLGAGIRKHYGRPLQLTAEQKRRRLAVRAVCVIDLLFVIGWGVLISKADNPGAASRKMDPWIILIMIVGVIGALGTLITIFNAVRSWASKETWIWTRVFDIALAVACVAFTWFIWHWNLINFNLKY